MAYNTSIPIKPGGQHNQLHVARNLTDDELPHLLYSTPLFGRLFECVGRPDLQWFVASAYYIISKAYPTAESLDNDVVECIDKPWDVSGWFSQFKTCVKQTGVVLVQTQTGKADFVDGGMRVTCAPLDKLLLLLVLLFGIDTCWADQIPESGPAAIKDYVSALRCGLARRYPIQQF